MRTRLWTDFVIWNHVFVFYEVLRCIYYQEYILCFLGGNVVILSTIRHLSYETKYNTIEPFFAKLGPLYVLCNGIYLFPLSQVMRLIYSKMLLIFVYMIEDYDYEVIHPWLHILAALDSHIYITYYSMLK